MANRLCFLVDGFNLYHSIKDSMKRPGAPEMRWLDIRALFTSYLHLYGRDANITDIHYFSAYAKHLLPRKPEVVTRHRTYVEAIKSTGVIVQLSRFKAKERRCNSCGQVLVHHEEKETDVWIAATLLRLLMEDVCDTAVLVSGDTDLAPAVRTAKELFPEKQISFAFPAWRANKELKKLADFAFTISVVQYVRFQFESPLILQSGRTLRRPAEWGG